LKGQVFDVLGKLFEEAPLRSLLIEAIRYGDLPEVRARLEQAIDNVVDQERVRDLLEQRSLAQQVMDVSEIMRIREDMERAAARRLQPHSSSRFHAGILKRWVGASTNVSRAGQHLACPCRHS